MAEEPEQPAEGEEPVTPPEDGRSVPDEAPAEPAEDAPAEDAPAEEPPAEPVEAAEEPPAEAAEPEVAEGAGAAETDPDAGAGAEDTAQAEPTPGGAEQPARAKPEIPGADLEVDIVPEGFDPLAREEAEAALEAADEEAPAAAAEAESPPAPTAEERPRAVIDLGADARYRATGKRKTAIARVILRPGKGTYTINGRPLDQHFPRPTLQRNIRQPLETVGYESRMDVVAKLHGGGISAQAGALRHGISRALIDADPNLRGELKRRGFLTRDARVKERKKAGLKKARKRPQFSKR